MRTTTTTAADPPRTSKSVISGSGGLLNVVSVLAVGVSLVSLTVTEVSIPHVTLYRE